MMHAVIKNSHDSLHLIGAVAPYNLESLAYHATAMQRSAGERLTHDGSAVHVCPTESRRGL